MCIIVFSLSIVMGINFNRHMILIDALMRILCQWRHPFAELLFQIICLHNSFVQMYFICIGRICIFLFCISINNRLALDFNPSDLFSHKMYTHREWFSLYSFFFSDEFFMAGVRTQHKKVYHERAAVKQKPKNMHIQAGNKSAVRRFSFRFVFEVWTQKL